MPLGARLREQIGHQVLRATLGAERAAVVESLSGIDLAALALAQDELGWQRLGGTTTDNNNDFTDVSRVQMVRRARLYWTRDPMAKRALNLYTAYALGRGMELHHKNATAQTVLKAFLADPRNRRVLGKLGLRKLSTKLLVDGEIFIAVIARNPHKVQVRILDALEISEIVSDPDDAENLWYYRRDTTRADGQVQARWYRAADADWNGQSETKARRALGVGRATEIAAGLQDKVQIIHVAINTLGRRGYPLLTPVLDWTKTLRKFMEDRAALTRAAAQFAFKKRVKGGPAQVAALTRSMRTGQPAEAGYNRQGPPAGSTAIENAGVDTEWFKTDTGAGNAVEDARLFRLQVQAGVGIPEHYFSDSSNGNLATATSMERPVELTFSEYQEVLIELLLALGREVLEAQGLAAGDDLSVNAPPILNVDVPAMLTALIQLATELPAFDIELLWRKILTLLDIEGVDAAIVEIHKLVEERRAQAVQIAAQGATPPGDPAPKDDSAAKDTATPAPAKGDPSA